MSSESDALTIARWCWPKDKWKESADGEAARANKRGEWFSTDCYDDEINDDRNYWIIGVQSAERVLIERGLAKEYGNALCRLTVQSDRYPEGSVGEWAVTLATAPLDARVRAMAATIRAQEAKP